MKGIVFNLLEQVVTSELGEEAWERVLEDAGADGVYTAVGTYSHEELDSLAQAAGALIDKPKDDVVRWFGMKAIPLLAERYPDFFTGHHTTISFVLQLNDVIHPEVRKLFPGAYAPEFEFDRKDQDTLALGYISFRDLCSFAEGLVEGSAAFFGETVTIEQTSCTRRGDEKCVLLCSFAKA